MKIKPRKSLVLLIILLSVRSLVLGQNWRKISLDDSSSVEIPGRVSRKIVKGQEIGIVRDGNCTYTFLVGSNAYDGNPIESELTKIYTETLQGTLKSLGACKRVETKKFKVNGFSGMEIQCSDPSRPGMPRFQNLRFLLANGTFYSLGFLTDVEHDAVVDANRNRFFSSFHTEVTKTLPVDPETQTRSYKLGALVGTLLVYGAIIYVLVVAVRRLLRPRVA